MKNFITVIIACTMLFVSGAGLTFAQNDNSAATVEQMKTLGGEIISLQPQSDPKVIGITYAGDNADYYFQIADDVKVVHKKNVKELQAGDVVEISFKETTKKDKQGRDMIDRQATTIKFVKGAKKDDTLYSE